MAADTLVWAQAPGGDTLSVSDLKDLLQQPRTFVTTANATGSRFNGTQQSDNKYGVMMFSHAAAMPSHHMRSFE